MSGLRIPTTNENWQGKNDPAERRRIQNRINQRAYRERQRAGESTRQHCPRSMSSAPSPSMESQPDDEDEDDDDDDDDDEEEEEEEDNEDEDEDEDDSEEESDDDDDDDDTNPSPPNAQQPPAAAQAPNPWDELARLINRNFLTAIATNARHLSLDPTSLRIGTPTLTPRTRTRNPNTPATLVPIELQHNLPHDPLIDTIPHARLRYNILRAIASRTLDPTKFGACLRRSGAVMVVQGEARRVGLIVWREPEVVSSWEVGEAFVLVWGWLLEGCEDLVAATNFWRGRRGERTLSLR